MEQKYFTIDDLIEAATKLKAELGGGARVGIESWGGEFGPLIDVSVYQRTCGEKILHLTPHNKWPADGKWPSTDELVAKLN